MDAITTDTGMVKDVELVFTLALPLARNHPVSRNKEAGPADCQASYPTHRVISYALIYSYAY